MLGPWPIGRPRHGGQIRAASIVAAYRASGHDVLFMGIFDPNNVPLADTTPDDVAIDQPVMDYIARSGKSWEFCLWDAFAGVPVLFARFEDAMRRFRPDVIQFEEPYLWPVVRALRDRGYLKGIPIVHSSYNFETEYRRDLAEVSGNENRNLLRKVAAEEEEIARGSDLVVAVSDGDAACFRSIGARRVMVVRNGGRRIDPTAAATDGLDAYLGNTNFALFVSSAHPPNARGLLDLAQGLRSPLPALLVICGGVWTLLDPHRRTDPLIRDARMLGIVDPPILDALLVRASVILLPKTRGGGSNLKTSEALLTGRPVVATTLAFVGFEPWSRGPGITIEDDPERFWQHVACHLSEPASRVTSIDSHYDGLLWPACVAPLVTAVQELVNASGRATNALEQRELVDARVLSR
jgi:glycosyltransferase involved in cell wall biosynthesis